MTTMGENNVGYVKSAVSSSSPSSSDSESEEDERQKELRKGRNLVCHAKCEFESEISITLSQCPAWNSRPKLDRTLDSIGSVMVSKSGV